MLNLLIPLALGASPAPSAPLADGTHRMVVDIATTSEVAFAGTTEVITRSVVRLDVSRTERGYDVVQQVCDVDVLSDARAETLLPDGFVAALPVQRYTALVSKDAAGELRWWADPGPTHVGYDPKVTGGPVPDKAKQDGVLDEDGDGHPGVTVKLRIPVFGTVRIYVAQRGHSRYVGHFADGGVEGRVEQVRLEQRTLGASFAPFAANPDVTVVPERSVFRIEKVADGVEGCAAVL